MLNFDIAPSLSPQDKEKYSIVTCRVRVDYTYTLYTIERTIKIHVPRTFLEYFPISLAYRDLVVCKFSES
jgi:hypothetical protein